VCNARGAILLVRAVAAGRIAAVPIHQYLTGQPTAGEPDPAGIALQPVDDPLERRLASFDEVDLWLLQTGCS
jgi:hypothetical protein